MPVNFSFFESTVPMQCEGTAPAVALASVSRQKLSCCLRYFKINALTLFHSSLSLNPHTLSGEHDRENREAHVPDTESDNEQLGLGHKHSRVSGARYEELRGSFEFEEGLADGDPE